MTHVDFYFDPSCPFSWITSRWLLQISAKRDVDITWRPFSLALKNDELVSSGESSPHAASHRAAHRVLRIMAAARSHDASMIDMYTAFGVKYHTAGFDYSDEWIRTTLDELRLPAELLDAADDTQYDGWLAREMQSALDAVGDDVGVPIIVFTQDDTRRGYFGPVLNELPDIDESLRIWDGLSQLGSVNAFYELKRSRPSGGPDTASTAKC